MKVGQDIKQCSSCKAAIYWDYTPAGKRCPFDADTGESHFKTCPNASKHSKKAQEKEPAPVSPVDERKWMRRVGPGNLTANLDSVTEVALDKTAGGYILALTRNNETVRGVFTEEQFQQWGAAFVYLTKIPLLCPDVEEVDDGIPF